MESSQILGIVAGIFTSTSLVPQLVKIIKEKDASNVSVVMLLVLMTGLSLWIWYGIKKNDIPIIATNTFSVLVNLALLFFRFRYGEKKDEQ